MELERSPTIPELAKAAGVTEEEVLEALESGQAYTTVSLSAPVGQGEDGELDPLESLGELEHGTRSARTAPCSRRASTCSTSASG